MKDVLIPVTAKVIGITQELNLETLKPVNRVKLELWGVMVEVTVSDEEVIRIMKAVRKVHLEDPLSPGDTYTQHPLDGPGITYQPIEPIEAYEEPHISELVSPPTTATPSTGEMVDAPVRTEQEQTELKEGLRRAARSPFPKFGKQG